MAKLYDALKRVERERRRQQLAASLQSEGAGRRTLWKNWFPRLARQTPLLHETESWADLLARVEDLERRASRSLPSPAELMLLERIEAITRRLDAFEERVLNRTPRTPQLVPALQEHLGTFERGILMRLSEVVDRLDQRDEAALRPKAAGRHRATRAAAVKSGSRKRAAS